MERHSSGEEMKRTNKFGMFLLAGVLATSAWGQATAKAKDEAKPAADKAQSEPTSVAGPDYIIGADDVLHISVWKAPDLTETLPVRLDGKISERKSTRLNSSHVSISYAVFCLKKK